MFYGLYGLEPLRKNSLRYLFLADLIFGVQYDLRSAVAGNEKNMELVQAAVLGGVDVEMPHTVYNTVSMALLRACFQ